MNKSRQYFRKWQNSQQACLLLAPMGQQSLSTQISIHYCYLPLNSMLELSSKCNRYKFVCVIETYKLHGNKVSSCIFSDNSKNYALMESTKLSRISGCSNWRKSDICPIEIICDVIATTLMFYLSLLMH